MKILDTVNVPRGRAYLFSVDGSRLRVHSTVPKKCEAHDEERDEAETDESRATDESPERGEHGRHRRHASSPAGYLWRHHSGLVSSPAKGKKEV